jgi:hypothetical protein
MLEAVRHIADLSLHFCHAKGTISFANFMGPALNMNSIYGVSSSAEKEERAKGIFVCSHFMHKKLVI